MTREELDRLFVLTAPARERDLLTAEAGLGHEIPADYRSLLRITDGLSCAGNLVLLGAADIVERNREYEVGVYLPGHVMIGDDSGGTAILMRQDRPTVHEVDMGVMDLTCLEHSASSLRQLLLEFGGRTLGERTG